MRVSPAEAPSGLRSLGSMRAVVGGDTGKASDTLQSEGSPSVHPSIRPSVRTDTPRPLCRERQSQHGDTGGSGGATGAQRRR